jgi:hypothetical protein
MDSLVKSEFAHRSQRRKVPLKYTDGAYKDPSGFFENCAGVSDPSVIATHDSIWHSSVALKTLKNGSISRWF